jgi:coenzyme F420-reducing hydrogenase alpha subunit
MSRPKQTPEFLEAWNTLNELNEGLSRQQMIDSLKKLGKNYKFDKYTDAQIWNMLVKLEDKLEKEAMEAAEWADVEAEVAAQLEYEKANTCQHCGRPLTTVGECPLCDLNDESVLED